MNAMGGENQTPTPTPSQASPAPLVDPISPANPSEVAMEIHTPDRPVHSKRDFFVHLLIVTVGILIALSLEGIVEWSHHRSLVREARANLTREIRANASQLGHHLAALDRFEKERATALRLIDDVVSLRPTEINSISLNFSLSQLTSAAWRTAEATGALGYMPYAEVRRYAEAYDLQRRFEEIEAQYLRDFGNVIAMPEMSEKRRNPAEFTEWKHRLIASRGLMFIQRALADGLRQVYNQTLEPVK